MKINLDYKKDLIKKGGESKIFKQLPKDATNLTISELFFLMNYINKAKIK